MTSEPKLRLVREEMTDEEFEQMVKWWVDEYGGEKPTASASVIMSALLVTFMYGGTILFALGFLLGALFG
jgi:hypothetical protein